MKKLWKLRRKTGNRLSNHAEVNLSDLLLLLQNEQGTPSPKVRKIKDIMLNVRNTNYCITWSILCHIESRAACLHLCVLSKGQHRTSWLCFEDVFSCCLILAQINQQNCNERLLVLGTLDAVSKGNEVDSPQNALKEKCHIQILTHVVAKHVTTSLPMSHTGWQLVKGFKKLNRSWNVLQIHLHFNPIIWVLTLNSEKCFCSVFCSLLWSENCFWKRR